MKKIIAYSFLAASLVAAAPAFADASPTASTGKDQNVYHSNVPDTPIWKNREFWRNEKERSGLPNFWEGTKNLARNMNPVPWFRGQRSRYEERRSTASSSTSY